MRRPDRSSSRSPSRFSSERTWRLTAGCVTPSRSAACEKLRRSTTAQKAASCFVSISNDYTCGQEVAISTHFRRRRVTPSPIRSSSGGGTGWPQPGEARWAAGGSSITRVAAPTPPRIEDTLITGYKRLATGSAHRFVDVELRALDVFLSALFLLVSLPLTL